MVSGGLAHRAGATVQGVQVLRGLPCSFYLLPLLRTRLGRDGVSGNALWHPAGRRQPWIKLGGPQTMVLTGTYDPGELPRFLESSVAPRDQAICG